MVENQQRVQVVFIWENLAGLSHSKVPISWKQANSKGRARSKQEQTTYPHRFSYTALSSWKAPDIKLHIPQSQKSVQKRHRQMRNILSEAIAVN